MPTTTKIFSPLKQAPKKDLFTEPDLPPFRPGKLRLLRILVILGTLAATLLIANMIFLMFVR